MGLTSFGGSPRIAATTAELEVESLSTALFSKCPNTNAVFGLPKLPIENGGCGGVGLSEEDATYVPAPGTPRAVILFHTNPGLVKDIFHSLDRNHDGFVSMEEFTTGLQDCSEFIALIQSIDKDDESAADSISELDGLEGEFRADGCMTWMEFQAFCHAFAWTV